MKTASNTEYLAIKQTKSMVAKRHMQTAALLLSAQQLKNIREKRLRALLRYAKTYSPWYQKILARIDVENFTEERLIEIPVLNKMTLMENWDEIVTNRNLSLSLVEKHVEKLNHEDASLYLLDRYRVMVTGGSSGQRGVFIYDWEEWNNYYLYYTRYRFYNRDHSALLLYPNQKITLSIVVASNGVYAMYSLAKTYKIKNLETYHFPMTLPLEQIIAGLNQTETDILQGTASTIYKLCQSASVGELTIDPKVISVGAEPLYAPIREAIEKAWPNAGIFNTLGSSEGLIGVCCHADSKEMHLNDDACIIQPVNKGGQLVARGTRSDKIYFTNLYNYTLPLIRYEFSDQLVFLEKSCECGVEHQLIAEPIGRPEFDFIYQGSIFVHHLIYVTALLHEKNIQEYQVIQTENGADIKILTIGFVDKHQLKNKIEEQLKKLGLSQPLITLSIVTKFDYPPSGKLRRFLPLGYKVI